MKIVTRIVFVFLVLFTTILSAGQARAQHAVEHADVIIRVEGLACPICAYGLEKRLKKIDSVETLSVRIRDGEVRMNLKEGAAIAEEQILEAVMDAGFTLIGITYRDVEAGSSRCPG